MYVLVAQSCLTLCDPVDCNPPGSPVHEILFSRGSSQPRYWTWVSYIAGIFWASREAHRDFIATLELESPRWFCSSLLLPPHSFLSSRKSFLLICDPICLEGSISRSSHNWVFPSVQLDSRRGVPDQPIESSILSPSRCFLYYTTLLISVFRAVITIGFIIFCFCPLNCKIHESRTLI